MSYRRTFRRRGGARGGRGTRFGRVLDVVVAVALLALLSVVAARWEEPEVGEIAGRALTLDGDTIAVGKHRLRLSGIDAPELDQTCRRSGQDYACGRQARAELDRLIGYGNMNCKTHGRDRYGRLLAVCSVGETAINREMVERGWALAYGGYEDAERRARSARAGLWAGQFERPEAWRAQRGNAVEFALAGMREWLRMLLGG